MSVNSTRVLFGLLAICASVAAGCGAARPIKYYQLTVPAGMAQASDATTLPVTLLVGAIQSSPLYREDPIVYSTGAEAMGTYENQRWAEPPVEMLQGVLARELRATGHYRSVNTLRSNGNGDYVLRGRLYDFKEVSGPALMARVVVEFELHEAKTGATVWSQYYAHDEPVASKDVPAVVAALDRNTQSIVVQVRAALDQYFSAHPVSGTTAGVQ
jgi:ABC-type uncharacterized transport system auxiliary subunit